MDDSAYSVEEVQTHKHLPGYLFDEIERQTLVVIAFEDFKQIDSENLEDHAEMVTVGSFVEEGVEQVENVAVIAVELCFLGLVLF